MSWSEFIFYGFDDYVYRTNVFRNEKKNLRYRRLVKYFAFNQPDLFEDYQEPESIEEFY